MQAAARTGSQAYPPRPPKSERFPVNESATRERNTHTSPKRAFRGARRIAILTGVFLLIGGGAAVAYLTTTGTGSGSAANSNVVGTVQLTAHFAAGLTPGSAEAVTYTATNTTGSSLKVGTISHVVSTGGSGCLVSDFSIAPVVSNTVVPAGATNVSLTGTGTLTFADTALNQNACMGAVVLLTLTSN
ncbi:hypothetical protein RCH16_000076 [Cryobacterium sp. MP_M5]|nr:hypothetical protein [Cryobacterium sp. MP_M5]